MNKAFIYLSYAGLIPFVLLTILLFIDINPLSSLVSVQNVLSVYGILIASFVAGSHWGISLSLPEDLHLTFIVILTNIIAILLWLGFLFLSFRMLLLMLISIFIIELISDYIIYSKHATDKIYMKSRFYVSSILIITLFFIWYFI